MNRAYLIKVGILIKYLHISWLGRSLGYFLLGVK